MERMVVLTTTASKPELMVEVYRLATENDKLQAERDFWKAEATEANRVKAHYARRLDNLLIGSDKNGV